MYFEFSYVCSPKYFYSNQRSLHSTWQTPSCHVKLRGVKDSAEESDSAVFKILSYYIQIMNESWDQMSLNHEKTKAKTFKHLLIPRCQRHRRRFLHMQISPRNLKHIWKYFSIFNKLSGRLENEEKKVLNHLVIRCPICNSSFSVPAAVEQAVVQNPPGQPGRRGPISNYSDHACLNHF